MKAVGELDQDNAHVSDHREDHLADVLSLLFFPREITDVSNLCQAVYKLRDLVAKIRAQGFEIDEGIFDHVVKKPCRNAYLIQAHIGENIRNLKRMNKIRF